MKVDVTGNTHVNDRVLGIVGGLRRRLGLFAGHLGFAPNNMNSRSDIYG
jgi:hypothetical protein